MEKRWLITICIAMLFVVVFVSIFASAVLNIEDQKEASLAEMQADAEVSDYGVDGKYDGDILETEPTMVSEEYVYFEDRVLERFRYNTDDIVECTEILNGAMNSLPDGVNKYLMLVPMRISLEDEKYQMYTDDVTSAINEIYADMPWDVVTIDAGGALEAHKDEYLFFRTDNSWTALGAYYAAKEFCDNIEIDMKTIEKYRESRFENYLGTMRVLPYADTLSSDPDYVSYYILKDASNQQMITSYLSKDVYVTYDSPIVAVSRMGYDIFIGGYFSHSILRGDTDNGKTFMILGDEYSKAFAPWLTPYCESIILINPTFYNGSSEEFWEFFSIYQITDCLIMEYGHHLGSNVVNDKIKEIFSTPLK